MNRMHKWLSPTIFLVAVMVTLLLPASLPTVRAQEVTAEPEATEPVTSTPAPTEPVVTEAVTEEPSPTTPSPEPTDPPATEAVVETAEATEIVTEPAPETTEVIEATEAVTQPPAETTAEVTQEVATEPAPAEVTTFSDDFTTFDASKWTLDRWVIANGVLSTTESNATATVNNFFPADFSLNAQFTIAPGNVAVVAFRTGDEAYRVMFSSNGSHRLYRNDVLLDTFATAAEAGVFDAS
ncbi:MAG: hypothetical protein AAFQ07_13520, partial [Chloroflexota bacterium]